MISADKLRDLERERKNLREIKDEIIRRCESGRITPEVAADKIEAAEIRSGRREMVIHNRSD